MPRLFIFFVIATIVSCTQTTSFTEKEKTIVIDSVKQTLLRYNDDVRKWGLTAEFNYLDSSLDFFWVPPGYSGAISYDSVAAILKQNAPRYKSIENVFDSLRVNPLSKEIATYTGRIHSTMTDTLGHAITFSMLETGTLIKRKDGWKLLCGQTSMTGSKRSD